MLTHSYTGNYAKHAIHPPKINTPKFKEIYLLVILQKERAVIQKKSICSISIEKNLLQSKSIEKNVKHDPLQNES
jgi:hypothetical protein